MPDIDIIKLQIRRGPDEQRKLVVLQQGELGYSTDYKRLWIGDGQTTGGTVIGNRVYPKDQNRISIGSAVRGDIVYNNNKLYQLASNEPSVEADWKFIGTEVTPTIFQYNTSNRLDLVDGGIRASKFSSSVVNNTSGLKLDSTAGLSLNVDDSTIEIVSNKLSIKTDSIDETHVKDSICGDGLIGGSGTSIKIRATGNFDFTNGDLNLVSLPQNVVTVETIDDTIFGDGIGLSNNGDKIETTFKTVDNTLTLDLFTGSVGLAKVSTVNAAAFDNLAFDQYGRAISSTSSLQPSLSTGSSTTPTSVFNGDINQTVYTGQSVISAYNGTDTISLTSAGFIQVDVGGSTGTVAIPIFKP